MSQCPLCGQKGMSDGKCSVCGYAVEASLHGDLRDDRKEDPLKQSVATPSELQRRYKLIEAHLSNMDMRSTPPGEASAALSAAVQQLSIPAHVPFDKVLNLTEIEVRLVKLLTEKVGEADLSTGGATLDAEAYVRLANAEYATGDGASALAHVDRAILREPKFIEGHYAKARIHFNENRYPLALRSLEKAVRLSPGDKDLAAFKALVEQMTSTER